MQLFLNVTSKNYFLMLLQKILEWKKFFITGGRYRQRNIAEFAEKTYAFLRLLAKILPVPISSIFF
jgi:hypothetical protein